MAGRCRRCNHCPLPRPQIGGSTINNAHWSMGSCAPSASSSRRHRILLQRHRWWMLAWRWRRRSTGLPPLGCCAHQNDRWRTPCWWRCGPPPHKLSRLETHGCDLAPILFSPIALRQLALQRRGWVCNNLLSRCDLSCGCHQVIVQDHNEVPGRSGAAGARAAREVSGHA